MLRNAVFVTENVAEKKHAQYDRYRYNVVGLKIDGADYTAKMTIGVDESGKYYYDHAVTDIEKGTLIDRVNGVEISDTEKQGADGFISTGQSLIRLLPFLRMQSFYLVSAQQGTI